MNFDDTQSVSEFNSTDEHFKGPKREVKRLIIHGRGETRGRRGHMLRLREGLYDELRSLAAGQTYLIVEVALQRLINDLKAMPSPVEIQMIRAEDISANRTDEIALCLYDAKMASKRHAERQLRERNARQLKERTAARRAQKLN